MPRSTSCARRARAWSWVALVCALPACAGSLRPAHPIADVAHVLERHDATSSGLTAMRAEARVDQRKSGGRIRGTVLMFVEHSGRVRFDVMMQFGPVAILTSDGTRFAYADFRERRFLTGETCPQNIARLLGVPLTAEETARFLLGGSIAITPERSALELNDDGHYAVQLTAASGARQQLELAVYASDLALPADRQRLYLVRSELWDERGQRIWRVTYSDFTRVSLAGRQVLMPERVHIEHSAQGSDTLVHFKEIVTNPEISDEIFVQTARPGMSDESAACD